MSAIPKVLFTSIYKPFEVFLNRFSSMDQMGFRLSRDQGIFTLYEHTHVSALHLLAQNIRIPSTVLEYPTFEQFQKEVQKGYDYIAISFKVLQAEKLYRMCDWIRCVSPRTQIIVGGYGAICTSVLFEDLKWKGKIDHICFSEGVEFIRRVFNQPLSDPIRCRLPREGSTLPWMQPRALGTIGNILSGLGCTQRCPFCVTSAFSKGRYVEVMNAEMIYQTMLQYWSLPMTSSATIFDENFLLQKEKFLKLSSFLQDDSAFGLSKLNYTAFGSIGAISQYDPEQLLLSGLSTVWVGVESKFTHLKKTKGMSAQEAFQMLHRIGIQTIGSWILGLEEQNPSNIEEDMEAMIALKSTFQQLSILSVVPGTPLWRTYKRKNKLLPNVPWHEQHLYGNTFKHQHFSHPQMLQLLERMYQRMYTENGPSLMRALETSLNGYQYCLESKHPLLRTQKSLFFKKRCQSYYPLLKAALYYAPSQKAKAHLVDLEKRFQKTFVTWKSDFKNLSDLILKKAHQAFEKQQKKPSKTTLREEPSRRYEYPALKARNPLKPYDVQYT